MDGWIDGCVFELVCVCFVVIVRSEWWWPPESEGCC